MYRSGAYENMKVIREMYVAFNQDILNRGTRLFADFLKFQRHHVNISGRDVTELYMAINITRSLWQCLKSAGRTYYSFGDTEAKVDWGYFTRRQKTAVGTRVNRLQFRR